MTKAQLVNECAELRKELDEVSSYCAYWQREYEDYGERHTYLRNALDAKNAECEALRAECEALRVECEALRAKVQRTQPAVPAYQVAAMQRRAQYEAAVAQGRRVKFVGNTLVDY